MKPDAKILLLALALIVVVAVVSVGCGGNEVSATPTLGASPLGTAGASGGPGLWLRLLPRLGGFSRSYHHLFPANTVSRRMKMGKKV